MPCPRLSWACREVSIHIIFPAAETGEKSGGVSGLKSGGPDLSCPRKRGHGTRQARACHPGCFSGGRELE